MQRERRYLQHDEASQQACGSDDLINGRRCPLQCCTSGPWSKVAANLRHSPSPAFPSPIRDIFGYCEEQLLEHMHLEYRTLHYTIVQIFMSRRHAKDTPI